MRKGFHFVKAGWAALAAAVATTVYEVVQTAIFPHISRWQCHFITIGFFTVVSFILALFILKRREADVELLQHEKRNFDNLVENMPGLACIVGRDQKLVRWNSHFQKTLGYSAEELSQMDAVETVAEDYRALVPEIMGAAWTEGHAEMEAAWLTKSGQKIPCYFAAVRIVEGNQPYVLSVCIDLSDQKRAQEELLKNEVQYRRLLANLPDLTWTMDSHRHITYVSPNIQEMFGYSPEQVLSGDTEFLPSRIHSDDLELVRESYRALFAEGKAFDVDYRLRRKDGLWAWVRSRSLRTYEHGGLLSPTASSAMSPSANRLSKSTRSWRRLSLRRLRASSAKPSTALSFPGIREQRKYSAILPPKPWASTSPCWLRLRNCTKFPKLWRKSSGANRCRGSSR